MSADLDRMLRRTAASPSQPLDVDGLLRRARRRRRRGKLLGGTTAVLVAVVVLRGAIPLLTSPSVVFEEPGNEREVPVPAPSPSPTPSIHSDPPHESTLPPPSPTPSIHSEPPHESTLPPAPIEGRYNAMSVWTGEEVLVWGGSLIAEMGAHPDQVRTGEQYEEDGAAPTPIGEVHFDDGAAYDPAIDTWRTIASAPFSGGYGDRAVWTGQQMLVWSAERTRLAAYDPAADDWRVLPPPPEPSGDRPAVTLVWTGSEAILWGGMDHQPELPAFGVAFDPATGGWRELPEAPVPARQWHTATWTGEEMIVWGGTNLVATLGEELGGAAYDPEADAWRALPLAPTGGRSNHAAVWSGSEVLVWGGDLVEGLAYDPVDDSWRVLAAAPVRSPVEVVAVWTGEALLAWGGRVDEDATDTAVYDPAADTWRELPSSPLSDRCYAATAWTGTALFAWSGLPDCDAGMPPQDGALLDPAPAVPPAPVPPAPGPQTSDALPDRCRVLDEGERHVSTTGLVGATLGPTLLEGIRPDLTVGPLVAVESDDPQFETPWYAVSAVVSSDRGPLGTATWLSPNSLAVYAGGPSTDDFEAWRLDPTTDPEATHLYSANDLAREVSIWQRTYERASAAALSRDCAQRLAAP